jgi:stage II sporulation protein R
LGTCAFPPKKKRVAMKRTLALVLLICALSGKIPPVLRLHVIANSDSRQDQEVKLQVRDAVIASFQKEMLQMKSLKETEAYVKTQLDNVKVMANKVLARNRFSYKSRVSLSVDYFPQKSYGGVVFPAGKYDALRIVLGNGKGHNWWCVLFPPLCLLNANQVQPDWQPEDGVTYKSWLLTLFK